jgi:hypothetical protein
MHVVFGEAFAERLIVEFQAEIGDEYIDEDEGQRH